MNVDDRKRREWEEATGVVVFMTVISIPIFFVLMSAKEAMQASALIMGVSFLIMGGGWAFFAPRKKPTPPKPERPVLTEAEFEFLASGVQNTGYIEALSTEGGAWNVGATLVAKGLLRPTGNPHDDRSVHRMWKMTSEGIDAALGGFDPAPGWYPFGNPDKRKGKTP